MTPEERAQKIVDSLQVKCMGSFKADVEAWPTQGMSTSELVETITAEIHKAISAERYEIEKLVEELISVDSGDPARWTDSVIVPLLTAIRARGEK